MTPCASRKGSPGPGDAESGDLACPVCIPTEPLSMSGQSWCSCRFGSVFCSKPNVSQSQHPFGFPGIPACLPELGDSGFCLGNGAQGPPSRQGLTARNKEGLPGEWGSTLGQGQQRSPVGSVHRRPNVKGSQDQVSGRVRSPSCWPRYQPWAKG